MVTAVVVEAPIPEAALPPVVAYDDAIFFHQPLR
jgi:hypothetical protein